MSIWSKRLNIVVAALGLAIASTVFAQEPMVVRKGEGQFRKQCDAKELKPFPAENWAKLSEWTNGPALTPGDYSGKVVLIDFWATGCGPCVREVPTVVATYEKLHPKGFEIVGISFDEEKDALEQFVKRKQMPWPQYFDGEGWGNKFGKEYGITGIPAMWLVDKKGNLRDLNAREDLAGKVEKMLAEK